MPSSIGRREVVWAEAVDEMIAIAPACGHSGLGERHEHQGGLEDDVFQASLMFTAIRGAITA
ncbi:MAG TPA: hypothetical protein VHQ45_04990 [Gemmatimonadaceae bacterium]|nr:hypothetical protein [Gemmatimonadaceae bacterium]